MTRPSGFREYTESTSGGQIWYDLPWADVVFDTCVTSRIPENIGKRWNLSKIEKLPSPEFEKYTSEKFFPVFDGNMTVAITAHRLETPVGYYRLVFKFEFSDGFTVAMSEPDISASSSRSLNPLKRFQANGNNLFAFAYQGYLRNYLLFKTVAEAVYTTSVDVGKYFVPGKTFGVPQLIDDLFTGFTTYDGYQKFAAAPISGNQIRNTKELAQCVIAGFSPILDFEWITQCDIQSFLDPTGWVMLQELKTEGFGLDEITRFRKLIILSQKYDENFQWIETFQLLKIWYELFSDFNKIFLCLEADMTLEETKKMLVNSESNMWDTVRVMRQLQAV